jgi:glyoxylase-like metal-dependent hydrolase (beta-lactamase superfamily II)
MENTYVLWDEESKECAVIDPGCNSETEEKLLERFIAENKLHVKYLIATHGHLDHVAGCAFIKGKYNPEYLIPENDLPLHENAAEQAAAFRMKMKTPPKPDKYISEDLNLLLGAENLKFISTPGHTPGGFCIYVPYEGLCITEDVLFENSIGRTDLWGGDHELLIKSIMNKLFVLPDETIIYPGHGEKSTIGEEKSHNPFLKNLV